MMCDSARLFSAKSRRTFISSSIALRTFFRAAALVFPCEKAPGTSGMVAIQNPSSPGSKMIVSSTPT